MKVKTPSRLHMGIIDLSREFKRQYGALGATIKGGFTIEIEKKGSGLKTDTTPKNREDIEHVYSILKERFDIGGYEINVEEDIKRHVGLGSTTQLSLGTAMGIAMMEEIDVDTIEMARIIDRGTYSAIGTHGFQDGGFIVEGGKTVEHEISPLTFREKIPEDWRFLIFCAKDWRGYDEEEEQPIMDELKVDPTYGRKISHHLIMGILPSLKTKDIEDFGQHISKIQRLVGKSFSNSQGGIFHPSAERAVEALEKHCYGSGQSSWGPTVYGVTTKDEVEDVKEEVLKEIDEDRYNIWTAEPDNDGAGFL